MQQKMYLDLIAGCKIVKKYGGVYCDSRKETHLIADRLIEKGRLSERGFQITDLGEKETFFIQVSDNNE